MSKLPKQRPTGARVTSYLDFFNAVAEKKVPSKLPLKEQKKTMQQPHNSDKSMQLTTGKCLTEVTENGMQEAPSELQDYLNKEERVLGNNLSEAAFRSVERFGDSQTQDKENTFMQGRSHSRKKDCGTSRQRHAQRSCQDKQQSSIAITAARTDEGVAHFILTEIRMIVTELTKFNRQRVTYMDFLEVLRELNMIQSNFQPQKDDTVSRLWAILTAGTKQNTTCLINLSIILLAVMKIGVRIKSVKEFFEDMAYSLDSLRATAANFRKTVATTRREYRRNKQGYFDLNREDVMSIYQQFKDLRVTRMFLGRIGRKSEKIDEGCQSAASFPFRPHITEKSRSLAKKRKSKQHFHSVNQIMEFQVQTEREIKQMEECTFQPHTSRNRPIEAVAGIKRSEILYKMAKKSRSKERKERRQDEVEIEREPTVFTFKPEISMPARSLEKKKPIMGEAKQIDRMIKARVEKEVKEKALYKGIPYNQRCFDKLRREVSHKYLRELQSNRHCKDLSKSQNKKKPPEPTQDTTPAQPQIHTQSQQHDSSVESSVQSEKQFEQPKQIPRRQIFTFEVYLEQDTCFDRITMYEGDDPTTVAHQFVVKHKLKEQLETKLARTLRGHLTRLTTGRESPNLCKIEEESVEYSVQI